MSRWTAVLPRVLMMLEKEVVDNGIASESRSSERHVALLLRRQNVDGGWGYYGGLESRVEPSSWALLALLQCQGSPNVVNARERALQYLVSAQIEDGSWPAAPQQTQGAWVTAVACLAVQQANGPAHLIRHAAGYLCDAWPKAGGFWWRFVERLRRKASVSKQNSAYRGWTWTPGTSSWVEPTACALIALRNLPSGLLPRSFAKRRRLAEAMLKDRMCSGGGWNSGNPMVYGVPGNPNVDMTCLALLALLWSPQADTERDASLRWLASSAARIRGEKSRAIAEFCLAAHDWPYSDLVSEVDRKEQAGQETLVSVWRIMAARPGVNWLPSLQAGKMLL